MKHPTKESFLRDVAEHELRILRDDGAYRHIQGRKKDGCSSHYFNIVTWPGSLAFNGDMGTFVFERNSDMFAFFRRGELTIDEYYWLQKCTGVCRTDGLFKFDADAVHDYCKDAIDESECSDEQKANLKERVGEEVSNCDDAHQVIDDLREFEANDGKTIFDEPHNWPSFQTPSFRAIWCLYAIVWAIARYDELRKASLSIDVNHVTISREAARVCLAELKSVRATFVEAKHPHGAELDQAILELETK